MPMTYANVAITDHEIPQAAFPFAQHMLDTYASETNKVSAVWASFRDEDLSFRPHTRSATVLEVLRHQLLSERRFFAEFLGAPEPAADAVLPATPTVAAYRERFIELARPRLEHLAARAEPWWLETVPFFDVTRTRIWVFWRRVLHTAHHRTQLAVDLRLLDRPVPPTYGPTADISWTGADPTHTTDAAARR
jgi:uncharacterized damage-inducible protein DinB